MITKQECDKICEVNDSFIRKVDVIDGVNVHQYSYILGSYGDFAYPLGEDSGSELDAFELRGITFVEQSDGSFECYPMLHKFFNINQTIDYMYDDVAGKTITQIQDKVDGSLISFVRINGKTVAKSKFSFISDQAKAAQKIYNENDSIKCLVDCSLNDGLVPIFEYIAFSNRIVVLYEEEELRLLQIRDRVTGDYFSTVKVVDTAAYYGVKCAQSFNTSITIDDLLELKKTTKNIEGWVVGFEDGQMMKIKTDWYFNLHGLISSDGDCSRINKLIHAVLNEQTDDMLSAIPVEFTEIREQIQTVESTVHNFVHSQIKDVTDYLAEFGNLSRKEFAQKFSDHFCFSVMMRNFAGSSANTEYFLDMDKIKDQVVELVKKRTNSLSKAEEFYAKL